MPGAAGAPARAHYADGPVLRDPESGRGWEIFSNRWIASGPSIA